MASVSCTCACPLGRVRRAPVSMDSPCRRRHRNMAASRSRWPSRPANGWRSKCAGMDDKLSHLESRIHEIKPDLEIQTVALNEEGLANDVVIVNGQWVFRFAKGEFGLRSL